MHLRKVLLSFFTTAILLLLSWFLFLFNQGILEENANNNLNYVPDNANFALRLDGREIAENTLFSIFLESKDEELLTLMQESFTKSFKTEGRFKNYGIDYLSDIILFEVEYKSQKIQGILVNISNARFFIKNLKELNVGSAVKDDVGVILSSLDPESKVSKSELNKLAANIVSTKNKNRMNKFIANRDHGKFIETYNKGSVFGASSYFGKSNILFELKDRKLILNGNMDLNQAGIKKVNTLKKIIQPKGLHFSSTLIPQDLSDTLNNWLKQFSAQMPAIEAISINFSGTKVINHSSGFFVVPRMELLVNCKSSVDIQKLLSNPEMTTYFDYTMDHESISFQKEKLYFRQVSPNSFYIGNNKSPVFKDYTGSNVVSIDGSLKPLTHIEGGGMMTAFLEMMPIYRASNTLASHTEKINLQLSKSSSKKVELKGDLEFSKGFYPMNELMKFLLIGQFIQ